MQRVRSYGESSRFCSKFVDLFNRQCWKKWNLPCNFSMICIFICYFVRVEVIFVFHKISHEVLECSFPKGLIFRSMTLRIVVSKTNCSCMCQKITDKMWRLSNFHDWNEKILFRHNLYDMINVFFNWNLPSKQLFGRHKIIIINGP